MNDTTTELKPTTPETAEDIGGSLKRVVSRARHRIAHWTGWNEGTVEVWWKCDKLMVGFKCAGCGKLSGIHESVTNTKSTANDKAERLPAQKL